MIFLIFSKNNHCAILLTKKYFIYYKSLFLNIFYMWEHITEWLKGLKSDLTRVATALQWLVWLVSKSTWEVIDLSLERLNEVIKNHPMLNDVFFVNDDWIIEVKSANESNILKWHFWFLPIVPAVCLKQLFREVTNHHWLASKIELLWMVVPGDKLSFTKNWLSKIDWTKVLSYDEADFTEDVENWTITINWTTIDKSNFTLWTTYWRILTWNEANLWTESELDNLVIQTPPFRFISDAKAFYKKIWELNEWDVVKWSYIIPSSWLNFTENWSIPTELNDEIAAQILSFWASYIIWNNEFADLTDIYQLNLSDEDRLKLSKEELEKMLEVENENRRKSRNTKQQTFIFRTSNVKNYMSIMPWQKVICKWIVWKVEKRNITIYYTLELEDWTKVQMWEFTWYMWAKSVLTRWASYKIPTTK